MKRLIYVVVCISILSLSGCANGILGGFGKTCNQGGLFSGNALSNGPFADGPVRKWLRGDECSTCNPPAGQPIWDSNSAPLCDSCGQGVPMNSGFDPYSQGAVVPQGGVIQGGMIAQPGVIGQPAPIQGGSVNSFYPDYNGAPMSDAGISGAAIDGLNLDSSGFNGGLGAGGLGGGGLGAGNMSTFGGNVESAIEPPFNGSINMN